MAEECGSRDREWKLLRVAEKTARRSDSQRHRHRWEREHNRISGFAIDVSTHARVSDSVVSEHVLPWRHAR